MTSDWEEENNEIRILLIGDSNVGKTSLIFALINEDDTTNIFQSTTSLNRLSTTSIQLNVPKKAETITVPAEVTSENRPTLIVDYNSEIDDEDILHDQIRRANSICLVYSLIDDNSKKNLESYWLPLIELIRLPSTTTTVTSTDSETLLKNHYAHYLHKMPTILIVGNKSDCVLPLISSSTQNRSIQLPQYDDGLKSLFRTYSQIHACIHTSAVTMRNVLQLFQLAQNFALYPINLIYNLNSRELSLKCEQALHRIFSICDLDGDNFLDDNELQLLQLACFKSLLSNTELNDLKQSIRSIRITYIDEDQYDKRQNNLMKLKNICDESGFFSLQRLYLEKSRQETVWSILRHFGYNFDLLIEKNFISTSNISPDKKFTLSIDGYSFLLYLFERFASNGQRSDEFLKSSKYFFNRLIHIKRYRLNVTMEENFMNEADLFIMFSTFCHDGPPWMMRDIHHSCSIKNNHRRHGRFMRLNDGKLMVRGREIHDIDIDDDPDDDGVNEEISRLSIHNSKKPHSILFGAQVSRRTKQMVHRSFALNIPSMPLLPFSDIRSKKDLSKSEKKLEDSSFRPYSKTKKNNRITPLSSIRSEHNSCKSTPSILNNSNNRHHFSPRILLHRTKETLSTTNPPAYHEMDGNKGNIITFSAFLNQWIIASYFQPELVVKYFGLMGYRHFYLKRSLDYIQDSCRNEMARNSSAEKIDEIMEKWTTSDILITALRENREDPNNLSNNYKNRMRINRNRCDYPIVLCDVIGDRGCGKTAFIQGLLGRSNEDLEKVDRDLIPNKSVRLLSVYGSKKYLILREKLYCENNLEISIELSENKKEVEATIVCLLYDMSNPTSFAHIANYFMKYLNRAGGKRTPCLIIGTHSDKSAFLQSSNYQNFYDNYRLEPEGFCLRFNLPPPLRFSSATTADVDVGRHIYLKLIALATFPIFPLRSTVWKQFSSIGRTASLESLAGDVGDLNEQEDNKLMGPVALGASVAVIMAFALYKTLK
ncbi:hypothetical protein SNEBB_006983 [Seison nebaliae]|nr:hypothetical protein SNEBB_006983 [Seison nebaliae]